MADELNNLLDRMTLKDPCTDDCLPFSLPHFVDSNHRTHLSPLPRYLFRLSTPRSDGITNDEWAKSKDARAGLRQEDIFSRSDRQQAAAEISDHLWWKGDPHRRDNLVSWTSSLLFACQYIVYRRLHNRDRSSFDTMKLTIIDTTLFPRTTFLRDVDLIRAFQSYHVDLSRLEKLRTGKFYNGEYLSQGSLQINKKCASISIQDMINNGLFDLQPRFAACLDEGRKTWAKEVNRLRSEFEASRSRCIADKERQAVIRIASLITYDFRLPMVAYLISLISCQLSEQSVLEIFRLPEFRGKLSDRTLLIGLTSQGLPDYILSPRNTTFIDHGMPEVAQAQNLAQLAYADRIDQQLKRITGKILCLRVGDSSNNSLEAVSLVEVDMRNILVGLLAVSKEDIGDVGDGVVKFRKLSNQIASVMTLCRATNDHCEANTDADCVG